VLVCTLKEVFCLLIRRFMTSEQCGQEMAVGASQELLDPGNSEPCISNLLSLFEPFKSDDDKFTISMDAMSFAQAYVSNPEIITTYPEQISRLHGDKNFSKEGIKKQISWKTSLISSIESFLLSNWDANEGELTEQDIIKLAQETLAYFLADETKRELIQDLFKLLAKIFQRVLVILDAEISMVEHCMACKTRKKSIVGYKRILVRYYQQKLMMEFWMASGLC